MRIKDDKDFTTFRKFSSKQEFDELFEGDYEFDTIDPIMADIICLPEITLRASQIESAEMLNWNRWNIKGEDHDFAIVELIMKSGEKHLVLTYEEEVGETPISD